MLPDYAHWASAKRKDSSALDTHRTVAHPCLVIHRTFGWFDVDVLFTVWSTAALTAMSPTAASVSPRNDVAHMLSKWGRSIHTQALCQLHLHIYMIQKRWQKPLSYSHTEHLPANIRRRPLKFHQSKSEIIWQQNKCNSHHFDHSHRCAWIMYIEHCLSCSKQTCAATSQQQCDIDTWQDNCYCSMNDDNLEWCFSNPMQHWQVQGMPPRTRCKLTVTQSSLCSNHLEGDSYYQGPFWMHRPVGCWRLLTLGAHQVYDIIFQLWPVLHHLRRSL